MDLERIEVKRTYLGDEAKELLLWNKDISCSEKIMRAIQKSKDDDILLLQISIGGKPIITNCTLVDETYFNQHLFHRDLLNARPNVLGQ